jgi:hypothetical protein
MFYLGYIHSFSNGGLFERDRNRTALLLTSSPLHPRTNNQTAFWPPLHPGRRWLSLRSFCAVYDRTHSGKLHFWASATVICRSNRHNPAEVWNVCRTDSRWDNLVGACVRPEGVAVVTTHFWMTRCTIHLKFGDISHTNSTSTFKAKGGNRRSLGNV